MELKAGSCEVLGRLLSLLMHRLFGFVADTISFFLFSPSLFLLSGMGGGGMSGGGMGMKGGGMGGMKGGMGMSKGPGMGGGG